jgi:hypothetical protein
MFEGEINQGCKATVGGLIESDDEEKEEGDGRKTVVDRLVDRVVVSYLWCFGGDNMEQLINGGGLFIHSKLVEGEQSEFGRA